MVLVQGCQKVLKQTAELSIISKRPVQGYFILKNHPQRNAKQTSQLIQTKYVPIFAGSQLLLTTLWVSYYTLLYATCTPLILHLICPPKILHNLCFSFLLGITAIPRELEDKGYAKIFFSFFFGGGGGGGGKKVHYGR